MTTVAAKLSAMADERAAFEARQEMQRAILQALPGAMHCPVISNETKGGAWLSFSGPAYDPDKTFPAVETLRQLEAAGFVWMPATLVRWDTYRRMPEPGLQSAIPETKGRYRLTDSEPIAPLWLAPCQYTGLSAEAYYSRDGMTFRVSVKSRARVSLTARRIERRGDWRFEPGSARLLYPVTLGLVSADGAPVAGISKGSRAHVDTEQGISGALYFEPYVDQSDWQLAPSEILAQVEAAQ